MKKKLITMNNLLDKENEDKIMTDQIVLHLRKEIIWILVILAFIPDVQ